MSLQRSHNDDVNNNNLKMPIAMRKLIEAQTQVLQQMVQSLANNGNANLPPEMLQMLKSQCQLLKMVAQNMFNNNSPQTDYGWKESKGNVVATTIACKIYGDIGHTYKEHPDQCPNCDGDHSAGKCPTSQVTCFLCEGNNHVPVQCNLYSMVQRVNQEVKDGVHQTLKENHEDSRFKRKVKTGVKPLGVTLKNTNKSCYSCGEEGHLSRNCSKMRERFPNFVVECEDQELQDLLALEKPKKKKKCNDREEKDISQVTCYNCKDLGHYATNCPEKVKHKANKWEVGKGSSKKDISQVECHKCQKLGHYSWDCL
jgi:hypothetical protein